MELYDLLRRVVESLERLDLPYFVTGSMATIFFGEPRFTNDIDIVVDLPAAKIAAFCASFPSEAFYVSEESARRAVSRRRQFNIIHPASGLKVDIIIPQGTPLDRSRFARRQPIHPLPDLEAAFSSPEDVILKKMESYKAGGSEKHLSDIAGVLKVMGGSLDREYIADWARRLGLVDLWEQILSKADGRRKPLTP